MWFLQTSQIYCQQHRIVANFIFKWQHEHTTYIAHWKASHLHVIYTLYSREPYSKYNDHVVAALYLHHRNAAAIPSFYLLVLADFPNPIYGFWKFIPIATHEQNTKAAPYSASTLQSSQEMQVCMCAYKAATTRPARYVIFNSLTN